MKSLPVKRGRLKGFRVGEIIYLRTGIVGDGFYKAVSIVNKQAMDYAKAVKHMEGDVDFGPSWSDYSQRNCAMAQKIYGEVSDRCLSRMRFQMPIF